MTVITSKTEIVVPRSVRRKAGIKAGDRVEFVPSAGTITILLKRTTDDEYTPAQRRIVDAELDKANEDIKTGRVHGPFSTHKEFVASLHREAKKLSGKKA